jgi:hypothetical protein
MTIPVSFLTAILKKEIIGTSYPGGLSRFMQDYPDLPEDAQLIGVPFMSGADLQDFVDSLKAIGFDVAQGLAIGEMHHGEWEGCAGIEFSALEPGNPLSRWVANAAVLK